MKIRFIGRSSFAVSMLTLVCILFLNACVGSRYKKEGDVTNDFALNADDRLLVIAPHPVDAVIGCGGLIRSAVDQGIPVRLVCATYGDGNEWSLNLYRKQPVLTQEEIEQLEINAYEQAKDAASELGLTEEDITLLGYPDFGTFTIWTTHWNDDATYRSLLNRARDVPYQSARTPGKPYTGESMLSDIKEIIKGFEPTCILVSHPADNNPDHEALYLFTQTALWDVNMEEQIQLFPYLVHYPHWPEGRDANPDRVLNPPVVLEEMVNWYTLPLSQEEIAAKSAAVNVYATHEPKVEKYLVPFITGRELFGDFPIITLTDGDVISQYSIPGNDYPPEADMPDTLTDQERDLFIDMEWRDVRVESNAFTVTVELSEPFTLPLNAMVYIAGYRPDVAFKKMPKITVKMTGWDDTVLDRRKVLLPDTVRIDRNEGLVSITIPLDMLGNPERIFIGGRTALYDVPLDTLSWRIIELLQAPQEQDS